MVKGKCKVKSGHDIVIHDITILTMIDPYCVIYMLLCDTKDEVRVYERETHVIMS